MINLNLIVKFNWGISWYNLRTILKIGGSAVCIFFRGELVGCFGLTEPNHGSDPAHMETKVYRKHILKQFIAKKYLVFDNYVFKF